MEITLYRECALKHGSPVRHQARPIEIQVAIDGAPSARTIHMNYKTAGDARFRRVRTPPIHARVPEAEA